MYFFFWCYSIIDIAKTRSPIKILRSPAKRWLANKFWAFLDYYPSVLLNIKTEKEKLRRGWNITSDAIFGEHLKNSENYIKYLAKLHFESRFRSEILEWQQEILSKNDENNDMYDLYIESPDENDEKQLNFEKLSKIVEREYYNYSNDIISVYHIKNGSNFYIYEKWNKPLTGSFFSGTRSSNDNTEFNFNTHLTLEVVNTTLTDYLSYMNFPHYFDKYLANKNKNKNRKESNNMFDYYYFLTDASFFVSDLKPIDWLHISPGTVEFSSKYKTKLGEEWHIQLEMAPFGMMTSMQYQLSHQFLYQVEGIRQFIVCSPSNHEKLHPYPEGHPRHQSSQIPPKFYKLPFRSWKSRIDIPFDPSALHSDGGLHNIDAYLVTLEPGEMLYIPPFYWYQSIAIDSGITVNSWTLGLEEIFARLSTPQAFPSVLKQSYQSIMADMRSHNSDNSDNGDSDSEKELEEKRQAMTEAKQKQRLHMLAYFVRYLIDRIVKTLPDSRDIPDTIDSNTKLSEFDENMNWDVDHYWIEKHLLKTRYETNYIWEKFECNKFDPVRCPQSGNTTQGMLRDIERSGKTWALAYKQLKLFISDKNDLFDIRNVMLGNHIEQIIAWVAGHSNICLFLQCVVNDRYGALYVETEEEALQRELKNTDESRSKSREKQAPQKNEQGW